MNETRIHQSKKQLKKLAKGGGKVKKEKPKWGDGSKKKAEKAAKEAAKVKEVFVNKTPKGEPSWTDVSSCI